MNELVYIADDTGRVVPLPRPKVSPKAALALYLSTVHPSRGHGATDCGEYLDGEGGLSDADHMLQWLAERGIAVVGTRK